MTYRLVSNAALRVGQIALLGEAVVRGVNYMMTPPGAFSAMNTVAASAPLCVWGVLLAALGVAGWFGEALLSGTDPFRPQNPRVWPSFIAHSGLACVYLAMACGSFEAVMQQHPRYGWLATYDLVGAAVANWMFARRRRGHA